MKCKNKRRDCPCDPRVWNRQTIIARFGFMLTKAFPDDSEFHKLETLFVP